MRSSPSQILKTKSLKNVCNLLRNKARPERVLVPVRLRPKR